MAGPEADGEGAGGALVVVASVHHGSTERVARAIAGVLGAEVRSPGQVSPGELRGCGLLGLGSGIYVERHHESILALAEGLHPAGGARAFIFSTLSIANAEAVSRSHRVLREILLSRGYVVVGEFGCRGYNTNGFLRWFGGMNRGHPDAKDLERAERFAQGLRQGTG